MQVSRYHKFLRIALIVSAFVLVFDGGFLSPVTKQLSDNTTSYVASLNGSMVPLESDTISLPTDFSTYVISAILALVITLLIINYIVHWVRARKRTGTVMRSSL